MRQCRRCRVMLAEQAYPKPDARVCRACRVAKVREWQAAHPEYLAAYREAHREQINARKRAVRQTADGKQKRNRYLKAYRARVAADPDRKRRELVRMATRCLVQIGTLVRAERCEHCGLEGETQAHHRTYDPMDVLWICQRCHTEAHRHERGLPAAQTEALREWWRAWQQGVGRSRGST